MLIYLGTFAVSVGIAAYGEHLRTKKNNEKGFYLCLALAVLVMAVLAGLRDPSIGRTAWCMRDGWRMQSCRMVCWPDPAAAQNRAAVYDAGLSGGPCFW